MPEHIRGAHMATHLRGRVASLASLALLLGGLAVVGGTATAAADDRAPRIDRVSQVVAQEPGLTSAGPVLVIDGEGFGDTPPALTEVPNLDDTNVGESALGRWGNTRHLHIMDEGYFTTDDAGLEAPGSPNSCYVTIGKWSDDQIIVMMDDAGLDSVCSAMSDGNDISVEVWSTDGEGYGTSPGSGIKEVGEAREPGDLARITRVTPASGPVTGGTFAPDGTANPDGTIEIEGDRLREASVVWFGEARYWGAAAVPRCRDGQSPASDECFTERDGRLTVVPPPAPRGTDRGAYLGVTTPAGTSHLGCLSVFTCDEGVFYYQSPSELFPSFDETLQLGYPDATIGYAGAKEVDQASCPGSAPSGPTGVSYSIEAGLTSGRVRVAGAPLTSVNRLAKVPTISSMQVPTTLTIEEAVQLEITLTGKISGCAAIPLLGGHLAGGEGEDESAFGGGVYMVIGGHLDGSVKFTVTVNKGVINLLAGYVPGQLSGASLVSEACVDADDKPAPCLETDFTWNAGGSVYFSPLWVDVTAKAKPHFEFAAGAGLTLAARAETGNKGSGYEVCYGGTYQLTASAKLDEDDDSGFEYNNAGSFWGPHHLIGNRPAACPLGEVEIEGTPTTTTVTAGEAVASSEGVTVPFTAAVDPAEATGTVSFSLDGEAVEECAEVQLEEGEAVCTLDFEEPGTHEVEATYAGAGELLTSTSEVLTHDVERTPQTITLEMPADAVYGDVVGVPASGGDSGEPVVLTVDAASTEVCELVEPEEGSEDDAALELVGAGTCTISADQQGRGGWAAAETVTRSFDVARAAQSIEVSAPEGARFGDVEALEATGGGSTSPVVLTVRTPDVCRLEEDGTTLEMVGVGTCTVVADQDGDRNHEAAERVERSIEVTRAGQDLSFEPPAAATTGGTDVLSARTSGTRVDFTVTPASQGVCALDEGAALPTVVYLAAGTCTVQAEAVPSAHYLGAFTRGSVEVGRAPTALSLAVGPDTLTARVAPRVAVTRRDGAPQPRALSGVVTFTVDGETVGRADLVDGVAVLPTRLDTARAHTVAASYDEDASYGASSATAERRNPVLTASVRSDRPASASGWYRGPVRVEFACEATTAPLVGTCPEPVVLGSEGEQRTVTGVVEAIDGGRASVDVAGLRIDTEAPRVVFVERERQRAGQGPVRVRFADRTSGVATRSVTRRSWRTDGTKVVAYRAVVEDRAGNRTVETYRHVEEVGAGR